MRALVCAQSLEGPPLCVRATLHMREGIAFYSWYNNSDPPLWDFPRNRLTLKRARHVPFCILSAVVAADWLRLDGGMET